MTAYDSVERGAADECEPLRGRRPRTFTLTQLLVACVAVCVCSIAATTAVNSHRGLANLGCSILDPLTGECLNPDDDDDLNRVGPPSALANFDDDYPEEAQLGRLAGCKENYFQVCEKKLQVSETCNCVNSARYEAYCRAHPGAYDCKPSAQKPAPGSRFTPNPGPDECITTHCTPTTDCTPNDCKA